MTPDGWHLAPLGDLAVFVNGDRGKNYPSRHEFVETGIPFINAGHITRGRIDLAEMNYITEDKFNELGGGKVQEHDLLYCLRGSLGKVAPVGDVVPGAIASSLVILRPRSSTTPAYLACLLTGPTGETLARELDSGSAQPNISATNLRRYQVLVPPLPEQRKIAAILSSVDEVIEKTEAVIEQLQVVKKAMMQQLLTRGIPGRHTRFKQTEVGEVPEEWEVVSLCDVALVQTGVAKGKQVENGQELPYLRVANVQDGYVDLSEMKMITVEQQQVQRYRLQAGDVLFTEGGDADKLGRGCVWRGQIDPCLHQNHVFAVRVQRDRVRPEFLAIWAACPQGKAYFLECAKQTTNLASINSTQLKAFSVPLPPVDEQDALVSAIASVDERLVTERAAAKALRGSKSALMSVLLTGELRVIPEAEQA